MTIILAVLQNSGISGIIVNSGIVAKTVLAILTVLSILSWAIAIDKIRYLRRCKDDTRRFLRTLPANFSIFESARHGRGFNHSPLPRLMLDAATAVERELAALKRIKQAHAAMIGQAARGVMERSASQAIDRMEHNLGYLATTASVSPFLGLFGTVWGVMNSFLSMGQMGSASITVVGSGVAEALITTVFGLGAAIPALVAYNFLVNSTRREAGQMESFISRVAESIEREILRELDSSEVSV